MIIAMATAASAAAMAIIKMVKKNLPFKNPNWKERRREIKSHSVRQKNIKQICANEALSGNAYNYQSIEAPPSTKPPIKYCDITGYPVHVESYRASIWIGIASLFSTIEQSVRTSNY